MNTNQSLHVANHPNKRGQSLQSANISRDLPIEYQIYQFISDSNEKGVDKQVWLHYKERDKVDFNIHSFIQFRIS
jgi:hypothetical protein